LHSVSGRACGCADSGSLCCCAGEAMGNERPAGPDAHANHDADENLYIIEEPECFYYLHRSMDNVFFKPCKLVAKGS
jgi:hypothetical protein